MTKKTLGISAFYHDSASAILHDDEIIAAAQEERFSRKKQDSSFPSESIEYCLRESGSSIAELDAVVFYDKPLRKFERLIETYYANAPSGLKSFLSAIPVWIKEKLFQKKFIRDELSRIAETDSVDVDLLFTEHHQSHAASAFYPSPFEEAAILTLDGVGEWATTTIGYGEENNLTILKELQFPHSIGLFYSAATYFLGFKVNSGEYKMMGLAPYGNPESDRPDRYEDIILDQLIDLRDDGSFTMDQEYFSYATGLRMVPDAKWKELFGFARRTPESDLGQEHCDLALAVQRVTEEIIFRLARTTKSETGSSRLCLAGGVALNCVANGKLLKKDIFDDVWIQPAAGDAGGALGSAYSTYHNYFDQPRGLANNKNYHKTDNSEPSTISSKQSPSSNAERSTLNAELTPPGDKMQGTFLGPEYTSKEIERVARKYNATCDYIEDEDELCGKTAERIAEGNVVGWFQGRMEWGPRALGNRSILGDPRDNEMQRTINKKIKYRESFRPFAPSVLAEDSTEYFDLQESSPYMILISKVLEERRNELPDDYHELPLKEKLAVKRSDIPSITHLDFTARLQTVHRATNPLYHKLISAFKERTGYGLVINTSFNLRGEPIVRTPGEAYRCFMRSKMDYVVMGNYVFDRADQPEWPETREEWRNKIDLD